MTWMMIRNQDAWVELSSGEMGVLVVVVLKVLSLHLVHPLWFVVFQ